MNKPLLRSFQDDCPWPIKMMIFIGSMFLAMHLTMHMGQAVQCLAILIVGISCLHFLGPHADHRPPWSPDKS